MFRSFFTLAVASLLLPSFAHAVAASAATSTDKPLAIVSTPNPNVFPLLLALKHNPSLPVRLIAVFDSGSIDKAFASQGAEALLAMTYTAAMKAETGKAPDLHLEGVYLWRGFFEVTPGASQAGFGDLTGRGIIISGPTTGGKGGGPDLFFQAAVKRAGYNAADFHICYLPVNDGVKLLSSGAPMNSNPACDPSFDGRAQGISLVEPAASGLAMKSNMPFSGGSPLSKSIDMQTLFTGYSAWPQDELPHGGLAIDSGVLADPSRRAVVEQVKAAYEAAIDEINAAHSMMARMRVGLAISRGITQYYGQYGMDLPGMVVARALAENDLRFRHDIIVAQASKDLDRFLTEVTGARLPSRFLGGR